MSSIWMRLDQFLQTWLDMHMRFKQVHRVPNKMSTWLAQGSERLYMNMTDKISIGEKRKWSCAWNYDWNERTAKTWDEKPHSWMLDLKFATEIWENLIWSNLIPVGELCWHFKHSYYVIKERYNEWGESGISDTWNWFKKRQQPLVWYCIKVSLQCRPLGSDSL